MKKNVCTWICHIAILFKEQSLDIFTIRWQPFETYAQSIFVIIGWQGSNYLKVHFIAFAINGILLPFYKMESCSILTNNAKTSLRDIYSKYTKAHHEWIQNSNTKLPFIRNSSNFQKEHPRIVFWLKTNPPFYF